MIVITISLLVIFSQIVEVPNFVNGLNTIATKWGKNNDVEIIEEEQYDTKITERIVISQSIKDGTKIFKKSSIKIIVSKGKDPNEKILVPEKDSATASDIKAWKEENDLSNVTIKEEHSSEIETGKIKSEKQIKLLRFLFENEGIHVLDLQYITEISRSIINTLAKNGYIEIVQEKVERNPFIHKDIKKDKPLKLTQEQQNAYNKIVESKFKEFLIYGVTGSRKNRNIYANNSKRSKK